VATNKNAMFQSLATQPPPREAQDYDYAGYVAKYGLPKPPEMLYDQSGLHTSKQGHFPDEFKLPSHMTFSSDSKYSNPLSEGGKWKKEKDGTWTFTASKYNLQNHTADELKEYFKRVEPGNKLVLPEDE